MPGRLDPDPMPRRDFLGLAGLWTAFAAISGSLVGMLRLPKPRVNPDASSIIRLGKPDDFPAGTSKIFPEYQLQIRSSEKGVAGISLVCTHLGCIVKESETGFKCPCHGSVFDKNGKVISGPAPRALHWLSFFKKADGSLMVDAGSDVKLGTFFEV